MKGPCWIKQWIADLAMMNEQFRNEDGTVDFAALGREEYLFRTALITGNFRKSSRAKDVYEIAKKAYDSLSEKGKKGGRPRKESTADAPTREDGEFKSDSGYAVNLESATSANLYGEAATSDGADVSTTFSDNFEALVSQRRAGADSVRGTPLHSAPARSPARKFRNKEEFIQWAIDTGLDPDDAGNCWEATMERGGLTKDGKKVDNICAYTVKWCRTSKKNRETA